MHEGDVQQPYNPKWFPVTIQGSIIDKPIYEFPTKLAKDDYYYFPT